MVGSCAVNRTITVAQRYTGETLTKDYFSTRMYTGRSQHRLRSTVLDCALLRVHRWRWRYVGVSWATSGLVEFIEVVGRTMTLEKMKAHAAHVTAKNVIKSRRSRTSATLRHSALRRSESLAVRWWRRRSVQRRSHCDTSSQSAP